MPVRFDEYDESNDAYDWALDSESNAYRIISFLAQHPDTGFTPKELHEETGIPRGSVGTTLKRLAERGLVRHKNPYWAVSEEGLRAVESVLVSLQTVEATTTYDWNGTDPAEYRIGLEAVQGDTADDTD